MSNPPPNLATALLRGLGMGNLRVRRMTMEFDNKTNYNGLLTLEVLPMVDGKFIVADDTLVTEIQCYRCVPITSPDVVETPLPGHPSADPE